MESKYDLLSIGDATFDAFIVPTESEVLCRLDEKECVICFSYGDKIPVKSIEYSIGGNAANNAVGTSRLGLKVAILLTLGDDSISQQIYSKLQAEGVDLTYVQRQVSGGSNYSTIISYAGERTIFSYHAPREYKFPNNLPKVPWVYLTSMGASFKPFYNEVVNWLKANPETKLAFNPGSNQFRAGVESFKDVLSITHTLFVNREEAGKITGLKSAQGKERELLDALRGLGVKMPVVTDGSNGSFVLENERYLKTGVFSVSNWIYWVTKRIGRGKRIT
jgi:sugar/nucleoside kinase (ribokinase family)